MIPLKPIPSNPNILIIGAGGIGCEVVKSLALAGFKRMTVVDFDTISVSNLSRQFFYNDSDVGREKAVVLAERASQIYSNIEIKGVLGDILSPTFNASTIAQFDFVFCAVDNVAARSKISQLCVLSRIALLDVGSSGKFAQSVPIFGFHNACYSCSPVESNSGPKVTCTIRSTPESFDHCASWSFHLFMSLFGNSKESQDVIAVVGDLKSLFQQLFVERITELRSRENMWVNRTPPDPLTNIEFTPSLEPIQRPTDIWSDEESAAVLEATAAIIKGPVDFDKDNDLHLAFTTAASNLQAAAFHIEKRTSMFDGKGIVTVVEPALATTNSIISAAAVLQFQRILKGEELQSIWMSHDFFGPKLTPTKPDKMNSDCKVCGIELWEIRCPWDTSLKTIGAAVGIEAPSIVHGKNIIYDEEEGNDKTLSEAGVLSGDVLNVDDLDGNEPMKNILVFEQKETTVELIFKPAVKEIQENSDSDDDYSDVMFVE